MTGWLLTRYPRRLPVFFMFDTSQQVQDVFETSMQAGLNKTIFGLLNQRMDAGGIDMTVITFAQTARFYEERKSLKNLAKPPRNVARPVENVAKAPWKVQGRCMLQPAFARLIEAIETTLDASSPEHAGDYAPLVFLILGSQPVDAWQTRLGALAAFTGNRRPMLITLLITQEAIKLAHELSMLSHTVLALRQARAVYLTQFFVWVPTAITNILASYVTTYQEGTAMLTFPSLPDLPANLVRIE